MIGDRKHNIIGANNTGIHSIGVTYGYESNDFIVINFTTIFLAYFEFLNGGKY